MNCRKARKLICEYVDGVADESVRLDLEQHLCACSECDAQATSLKQSLDLLHRAPVVSVDDDFAWQVRLRINRERHRINEAAESSGALVRRWNLRFAATAAAAMVVLVGVGAVGMKQGWVPTGNTTGVGDFASGAPATERVVTSRPSWDSSASSGPVQTVSRGGSPSSAASALGILDREATPQELIIDQLNQMDSDAAMRTLEQNIRWMQVELQRRQIMSLRERRTIPVGTTPR